MENMSILHAIIFGIIEGITEFLPISSTGHLTIAEKLLGYQIDDVGITAFTAIIQVGAILATILFFWKDIIRVGAAWLSGIFGGTKDSADYRLGWGIIIGSIPIAVIGLLFKDQIETGLRSLWFVAIALIAWSGVMYWAETNPRQNRHEKSTTWRDALFIGIAQCIALIPGVSRSGATISAGLFRGFDRMTATRLSFFLAIPALLAAGALEAATRVSDVSSSVGWTATIVGTVVSFISAYFVIAWLIKFIATHSYKSFIAYRVALGVLLMVLLTTGVIS
jgi:undecaprenyl-diphosphatase